jgi:hypothetical protein
MNQSSRGTQSRDVVVADGEPLHLRNPYLAAFLAWLIPGAGHYYQRRYVKSALFFVCIMSSFMIGMLVSGGRCVYASWNATEKRWQYVLQAGIGLPAIPAVIQNRRSQEMGQLDIEKGWMMPPRDAGTLDKWNHATASGFDMGTLYTMIAGLLNILVVFDAFAGPLPPPVTKEEKKQTEDESADAKT